MNVLDRAIALFAPQWARKRAIARLQLRHFESASSGRRTSGWNRTLTDANAAASGATLAYLRAQARDLVRNNPWARRALRRICSNTVGWGIRPKATGRGAARIAELWKLWAETTQCDAAGRLNMYGLQSLAMSTIAESGEVLIRRRMRRPIDGLDVPMQLQILEPDFIDTSRDGMRGIEGGEIVQGVEFNAIGQRVAYWLYDQHPGGRGLVSAAVSRRVPADGILHVFKQDRPGQVRGPSWFASVDLRLHQFDEFEGATLDKQKIAACMAAFVTDLDGTVQALAEGGTDAATGQLTDTFEPGAIISLPAGKNVTFPNPPAATDYQAFSTTQLRGIAAGIGVTYEEMTGDYSQVNFSSGRMGRIGARADRDDWIWNMLVPQLCQPVWNWMLDAMILAGELVEAAPAEWSPAPMPTLEPQVELKAYKEAVRDGFMTWPQVIRELGYDPRDQLIEIRDTNKELDRLGIALDCDPRRMTGSGGLHMPQVAGSFAPWPPKDRPAAQPAAPAPELDEDEEGEESARENGAAH